MNYYHINEEAARRAKNANSWSDYSEGSATADYKVKVDEAAEIAEKAKKKVEPQYHAKIDYYLDLYAKKLADNINRRNEIDARVPSVMIAGGSNFPVRAKEKQNAARDRNWAEYNEIQGLLDKIKSIGHGGIMSDDPNAVDKLTAKLIALQAEQEKMKAVNAYYRKNKTLDGCPVLTEDEIRAAKADMANGWRCDDKPFPTWALSNNNANIRRIKERIESMQKEAQRFAEAPKQEEAHDGYTLTENAEIGRIQFIFDGKPDADTRTLLKSYGFKWAPSQGAWQRMLNDNGRYAAQRVIEKLEA